MSTTDMDVAYDNHLDGRRGPRDRHHEDSSHVMDALRAWINRAGGNWISIHPQEIWAGKTPIGPCVRIRTQAARTSVESSVERMLLRAQRHPEFMGVPMAIAMPDLPRLRRSVAAVVARAPELPMTWLFVSDTGHVMVVPPPRQDAEATGPTDEDQSSTRSDLTA